MKNQIIEGGGQSHTALTNLGDLSLLVIAAIIIFWVATYILWLYFGFGTLSRLDDAKWEMAELREQFTAFRSEVRLIIDPAAAERLNQKDEEMRKQAAELYAERRAKARKATQLILAVVTAIIALLILSVVVNIYIN